jgi:16S rRNA (cytosine1402-N4)-methyltransferase
MKEDLKETQHIPVLVQEVKDLLSVKKGDIVFDGTLGGGGHMKTLLPFLGEKGKYIACDIDYSSIERAKEKIPDSRILYVHRNFRFIKDILKENGIEKVQSILLDLGISSDQLTGENGKGSGRGFSFLYDEPLSMSLSSGLNKEDILTAEIIVNEWAEESLADIIYGFGEEKKSRRIARKIVEEREKKPLRTTYELADIVSRAVGGKRGKTHPATRTFQALRIAVNDELGSLSEFLSSFYDVLENDGRIAIITFHSLEDRLVKNAFRSLFQEGKGQILTKKPHIPDSLEVSANPRSRSAKIRAFQKK